MTKQRKKRISHEESIRLKITHLETEIKLRDEHFEYFRSTMKHFKYPERRVQGWDTIQYQRDYDLLVIELNSYKKYYEQKFGKPYGGIGEV